MINLGVRLCDWVSSLCGAQSRIESVFLSPSLALTIIKLKIYINKNGRLLYFFYLKILSKKSA
jgi:hypothetical protein